MICCFFSLAWLVVVIGNVTGTQELDQESLENLLQTDRGGMIKFYQPWCGHSTRMKPDWDLLAEHFKEDSFVFIADVNCQIEEELCSGYHRGGTYPTVLVFPRPMATTTSSTSSRPRPPAEIYQGGQGFEDLRKFVDQTLVVPCSLQHPEQTCRDKATEYIAKWRVRDRQDQQKEMVRLASITTRDNMTYELSKWVTDRIQILEQMLLMTTAEEQGDEL